MVAGFGFDYNIDGYRKAPSKLFYREAIHKEAQVQSTEQACIILP